MIARILRYLILGIRPFLGYVPCKYKIGCTSYAVNQLETQSLSTALCNIIKRLIACSSSRD